MRQRGLSAVDAQTFWTSAKIPNDQFLLYGFAGVPSEPGPALEEIGDRARDCPELALRIQDRGFLTYPAWVAGEITADQFVVHDVADRTWAGCLAAVARLGENQLDARAMTWRLHVFTPVEGVPGSGAGTVVVLQAIHALGDGIRVSALAALLLVGQERCLRWPRPDRFWALRCRGAAFGPPACIGNWSAMRRLDWFPGRRIRVRRYTATRVRPGCEVSARSSGAAISCPDRR